MKYERISELLTEIVRFTNQHNIDITMNIYCLEELHEKSDNQSSYWARFEKHPGTYCFFNSEANAVEYIGMSMSNTGARIFNWLFKDLKIKERQSPEDLILVVSFKEEQHYMAPALESYLIKEFEPTLNKKG